MLRTHRRQQAGATGIRVPFIPFQPWLLVLATPQAAFIVVSHEFLRHPYRTSVRR